MTDESGKHVTPETYKIKHNAFNKYDSMCTQRDLEI
jgi:hypothetical protein